MYSRLPEIPTNMWFHGLMQRDDAYGGGFWITTVGFSDVEKLYNYTEGFHSTLVTAVELPAIPDHAWSLEEA